jgi:phosphoglycolate phosphatase
MSRLRLVIFDVDGTLVDSEADILAAMTRAYEGIGKTCPSREAVRGIVGLSLDVAIARLAPECHAAEQARLVAGYKAAYADMRQHKGAAESSPLFPGAREVLEVLGADPWTLLAVATGKSQRGLDKLIEGHGLHGVFASRQTADHHPSKPHPSMIEACLAETGATREATVLIGDTTFDMEMAAAAGVRSIGVSWGYHPVASLRADRIAERFEDVPDLVDAVLRESV